MATGMSFSFNETAGNSKSTTKVELPGNAIHKVRFDGCELTTLGKETKYTVLKIKFSNEDGVFEDVNFELTKQDDFVRQTAKESGKEKPSNYENLMLKLKHLIDFANPQIAKEIDEGTKKLGAPDFSGLADLVIKITTPAKGKETHIKLGKNGKGKAIVPYFSGLDPETGKAKVFSNFIGDKLFFSAFELERQKNAGTPSPTNMAGMESAGTGEIGSDLGSLNVEI